MRRQDRKANGIVGEVADAAKISTPEEFLPVRQVLLMLEFDIHRVGCFQQAAIGVALDVVVVAPGASWRAQRNRRLPPSSFNSGVGWFLNRPLKASPWNVNSPPSLVPQSARKPACVEYQSSLWSSLPVGEREESPSVRFA